MKPDKRATGRCITSGAHYDEGGSPSDDVQSVCGPQCLYQCRLCVDQIAASLPPEKLKPGRNEAIGLVAVVHTFVVAVRLFLVHPLDRAGRPPLAAISWNAWYDALVT
jgi:hypothetical protein